MDHIPACAHIMSLLYIYFMTRICPAEPMSNEVSVYCRVWAGENPYNYTCTLRVATLTVSESTRDINICSGNTTLKGFLEGVVELSVYIVPRKMTTLGTRCFHWPWSFGDFGNDVGPCSSDLGFNRDLHVRVHTADTFEAAAGPSSV